MLYSGRDRPEEGTSKHPDGRKAFFSLLAAWVQDGIELILPSFCLACGKSLGRRCEVSLCPDCMAQVHPLDGPCCSVCGLPLDAPGTDHLCGDCLHGTFAFSRARALYAYREPITSMVSRLKYGGDRSCLPSLSRLARRSGIRDRLSVPDLVVPVPLHPARLRERGFNQALVIAAEVFPEWRGKIAPATLTRTRKTRPQVGLDGRERRSNLRGAFSHSAQGCSGAAVLLVDDIYTTGTTADECARTLISGGATRVEVFTLARTQQPGR